MNSGVIIIVISVGFLCNEEDFFRLPGSEGFVNNAISDHWKVNALLQVLNSILAA